MPELHLTINGRNYPVACDEGEEGRLRELAHYVDGKAGEFARKLGPIGEARLLVLAALVIADELSETRAALRKQPGGKAAGNGVDTDALADGLEQLADRIEEIAERLE